MSGWDGIIDIFNPGHRHSAEERDRKRIGAQIPGNDGDPNRTWIDLDRGVITIAPRTAMSMRPNAPTARPEFEASPESDD